MIIFTSTKARVDLRVGEDSLEVIGQMDAMHAYVIIAGLAAGLARADCHQPERFRFLNEILEPILNYQYIVGAVDALEEPPWQYVP